MLSVQRIHKLISQLGRVGPFGTGVGDDAAVHSNEQFGGEIVLQVSSEPHRGFVFLEGDRSELLLSPCRCPFWCHLSASLWDISL